MAIDVDSLQIEIGADSKKAQTELEKTTTALKEMREVLNSKWNNPIKNTRNSAAVNAQTSEQEAVEGTSRATGEQADKVNRLAERWRALAEVFKESGSAAWQAAGSVAKFTGNLISAPFKSFARGVSNTIKKLQQMGRAVGRIIMYRAIRAAIRMVTESIKEGVNNLYQYSAAVGTTFKGAMDTIATAALYIKNSLGSMLAPLIENAAPIIDMLSDKIAALANRIAELMAALSGKDTFSKAIKYTTQYAEATNAAAKAAKAFLLPFDELNVMSDKQGSGAGDALDYSQMFEEAEVSLPIADFAENVRQAFGTVQEHINGLDFTNVEASFTRLQEALGPLVDTISEGLGWAYENVLVPLSEWTINEAVPAVIDLLASAVNLFNEALQALQPFADWFWQNILSPIAEWTGEIFIGALESITHILDELTSLLRGDKSFGEFIDSLSTGEVVVLALAVAFGALALAFGVATIAAGAFTAVMAVLTSPVTLVVAAIAALIAVGVELYKHWDEISAWLGMIWDNMKQVAIMAFTAIGDFFVGLGESISEVWNNIWGFIKGILNAIIGGIEGWVNGIINSINFILGGISDIASAIGGLIGLGPVNLRISPVSLPRLASGGIVDAGQLFIAREAGPELVANIGNRTAVMNNDQIVDSVENGVARANERASERVVSALYAVGEAIVDAIENGGSLDEVALAKAVNRGTMRLARMGGI